MQVKRYAPSNKGRETLTVRHKGRVLPQAVVEAALDVSTARKVGKPKPKVILRKKAA